MNNEYSEYLLPLGGVAILLMLLLLYLVVKYRKEIKVKDEKIKALDNVNVQIMASFDRKNQLSDKRIIELTQNVKRLETNAYEGTKNQVVTKIEEQQKKRLRELKRTGLEV